MTSIAIPRPPDPCVTDMNHADKGLVESDSDKGMNYPEECTHSHVSYCVGQTDLKGEARDLCGKALHGPAWRKGTKGRTLCLVLQMNLSIVQ